MTSVDLNKSDLVGDKITFYYQLNVERNMWISIKKKIIIKKQIKQEY